MRARTSRWLIALLLAAGSGSEAFVDLWSADMGTYFHLPGWGWIEESGAVTIDGRTIRMRVSQDLLGVDAASINVRAATYPMFTGDEYQSQLDAVEGSAFLDSPDETFETDLDEVAQVSSAKPVFESFTLPALDPEAVWDELKATYGLTDDELDAVAIHQSFFTDLILYASAYSTVGNPAVDGISWDQNGYGTDSPRSPALLHMNRWGFRLNEEHQEAVRVLEHEIGHRWLYFVEIDRGAGPERVLNPAGGHPAQYVHTAAAFQRYSAYDSSVMGGAWFSDNGDGSFSVPERVQYWGYSWHELYLMGLAQPAEVEPWFYVADSDPQLGDAYYPPDGITVSGARIDVGIADSQSRDQTPSIILSIPSGLPSRSASGSSDAGKP